MCLFLTKIFSNPSGPDMPTGSAYAEQAQYLRRVWNEETFGLERLTRLWLCAAQFVFPVLLIREVSGRRGSRARKLCIEAYTALKLAFPLVVLWQGWYGNIAVAGLAVYFLCETFVHILHLIFLSDVHAASVSFRRSLLLIFLHYAEVALDFAVVYMAFDLLNRPMDAVSAVYFSVVAAGTVGFGDITPAGAAGRLVVISQLAVSMVFVVLFINYFTQKVGED